MARSTISRANARLEARVSQERLGLIKRAAQLQGRSVSDFVVEAAHEAALHAIEVESVVRLSLAEQETFARALLAPPPPNAALKRAFARRQRLLAE